MSGSEKYDAIIIGSGKGGKILATYLGKQNHKVTLTGRTSTESSTASIASRLSATP